MSKNILKEKSFDFAVRIVHLFNYLQQTKKEYAISKQIIRSGTNPGAMCREAEHASSKKDFVHKLKIAQKEIAETMYWLELLHKTLYLPTNLYNSIYRDAEEILKIIIKSILTIQKKSEV